MALRCWPVSLAALAGLGLLLGCSTVSVHADWDSHASFTDLRTWAWIPAEAKPSGDASAGDPLTRQRIRRSIAETLDARGYRQIESGQPDFFVAYHVAITQKLTTRTIYTGYRPYRTMGVGVAQTQVESYDEGTLLIDIVDPGTLDLIWRGTARSRLQELQDPARREARIREAVQKVLALFPPSPREGR